MNTYKRSVKAVTDENIKNYNKYFNQLTFTGIKHNKNVFAVDQESFSAVQNVFVNYENSLASRPPVQFDETFPTNVVPSGFSLIETKTAGNYTVYVSESLSSPKKYYVTIDGSAELSLSDLNLYHISIIQHYIICFNDQGAKVFDVNVPDNGWVNLSDMAEVPIIKRVVGSVTTDYEMNGFTNAYKTQYIWSNTSKPILPTGTPEVELNTEKNAISWTIPNANVLTDYRILRPVNFTLEPGDLFSTANGIICIAREEYFLLSYDYGATFDKEWYPEHALFLNIASISKDGLYFFFVAKDGVYRCNLGNKSWTKIQYLGGTVPSEDFGTAPGFNNICYFSTSDLWCFLTYDPNTNKANIYWQGPGLTISNETYVGLAGRTDISGLIDFSAQDRTDLDCDRVRLTMNVNNNRTKTIILGAFPSTTAGMQRIIGVGHFMDTDAVAPAVKQSFEVAGDYSAVKGSYYLTARGSTGNDAVGIGAKGLIYRQGGWYEVTIETGLEAVDDTFNNFTDTTFSTSPLPVTSSAGYPYKLNGGWICNLTVYNSDADQSANLPNEITTRGTIWTDGEYFYIQVGSTVYTNNLTDNDSATLTYLYNSTGNSFTRVPTISYADTELYLAFGNVLQITQNKYDGINVEFNLPPINDNSFVSDITALLNISTTELAIFFTDKIMICSKVEDETFGYRYDYYNTKLSLGVRPGDSVINTLEGNYTVFPTLRGLALMNYQVFIATTDQVVNYITDDIKDLWTIFYQASSTIKIVQWLSHLIITNGTTDMLLFDMRNSSWWLWKVPLNIAMITTDQTNIKLISGQRYVFKDDERYWDFPRSPRQTRINWYIESQPLHMNAPNYYKNLKQLVFQLVETSKDTASFLAQIKLYRKKVTVREPEIVSFIIDELRTFVKRFNYWKIYEVQWGLASDSETVTPAKLLLNGLSVKYEYGDEVR